MRVIVVGAGVIGLSCAIRLAEGGYDVAVFARDLPLETTSSVAAAIWYPYLSAPEDRVAGWSRTSYEEFAKLAEIEPSVQLRHGRDIKVDDLVRAHARRGDIDAVFVDRCLPLANLLDQRQQRAAERRKAGEVAARQDRGAGAEEILGIGIGVIDEVVRPDHDHRAADGVQNDMRAVDRGWFCRRCV